jgi:hypothetical protein
VFSNFGKIKKIEYKWCEAKATWRFFTSSVGGVAELDTCGLVELWGMKLARCGVGGGGGERTGGYHHHKVRQSTSRC